MSKPTSPLDVACPNCKVPAGQRCQAKGSRRERVPHEWRQVALLRARAEAGA